MQFLNEKAPGCAWRRRGRLLKSERPIESGAVRPLVATGLVVNTEITLRGASEASGTAGRGLHLLVMSTDAFFSQPLPPRGVVTVGRSSKCQVRVDDPLASREHAHIQI